MTMPFFQPYDDIPPIDDNFEIFRIDTPHHVLNLDWTSLNPGQNEFYHTPKHFQHMRERVNELEQFAYGQPPPLQIATYPTLDTPWTDQCRNIRYQSPSGPLGGTLSCTDSSPSEYAFSPDASRRATGLPAQHAYSYPTTDFGHSLWSQPHTYAGALPSPCTTSHAACALKDLQRIPDTADELFEIRDTTDGRVNQPEEIVLSPELASPVDSGLGQSLEDDEDYQETDGDTEYTPHRSARRQPGTRRSMRGPGTSQSSGVVLDQGARISKPAGRRMSNKTKKASTKKGDVDIQKHFTCTFSHYGCDAKFASKNEWKRHVASQHLQLGFYRCDVGPCNPEHAGPNKGYNDFNRKDLFTQHMRRMHVPWAGGIENGSKKQREEFEAGLEEVRERCWSVRRDPPPRSGCGLCGRIFEDDADGSGNSWEERMEHVGKHFEKMDWDLGSEREDEDLTRWAVSEGIVRDYGGKGRWLVGVEPPKGDREKERRGRRRATVEVENGGHDEDEDAHGEVELV